jgi:hypothetical protein
MDLGAIVFPVRHTDKLQVSESPEPSLQASVHRSDPLEWLDPRVLSRENDVSGESWFAQPLTGCLINRRVRLHDRHVQAPRVPDRQSHVPATDLEVNGAMRLENGDVNGDGREVARLGTVDQRTRGAARSFDDEIVVERVDRAEATSLAPQPVPPPPRRRADAIDRRLEREAVEVRRRRRADEIRIHYRLGEPGQRPQQWRRWTPRSAGGPRQRSLRIPRREFGRLTNQVDRQPIPDQEQGVRVDDRVQIWERGTAGPASVTRACGAARPPRARRARRP